MAGPGDDAYGGGAGSDTIDFVSAPSAVEVDLTLGTATGFGSDSLAGTENILGTKFADVLTGDGASNFLSGRGAPDEISGGDGDDRLSGGRGDDILDGGTGRDTVTYADLSGKQGFITADLAGGGGADILEGFGGDDLLEGGNGSDIGDGGDGFDTCVEVENVMNCEG